MILKTKQWESEEQKRDQEKEKEAIIYLERLLDTGGSVTKR